MEISIDPLAVTPARSGLPASERPDARRARASSYGRAGGLLALGAPLGLLLLRAVAGRRRPSPSWLVQQLARERLLFAYVTASTVAAFGLFGRALGRREDRVEAQGRELERLREEFAAVITHDLRNPLSALRLELDLLLERVDDQGDAYVSVDALRRMRTSIERLGRMVDDLLDTTRLELGRLALEPRPVELAAAVRALVGRMSLMLADHQLSIDAEGPPTRVAVDPDRLDQIVGNLLDNAAKYSPAGSAIAIRVRSEPDGGASVAVSDQGIGIAPEERAHLFDRFFQAPRARARRSGLGLGLFIVKGLVTAHGGRIDVQSSPGRGSTFTVWLPPAR